MLSILEPIIAALRRSRDRRRIAKQFLTQGFIETDCPHIVDLLPLRFPETIQNDSVAMYSKEGSHVLVVPTTFTPRTRTPHKPHVFILMSTPFPAGALQAPVSAGLRAAHEQFSIVDQLDMDSYPSISPLPDFTIFASDERSATAILPAIDNLSTDRPTGSVVVHNGQLFMQLA